MIVTLRKADLVVSIVSFDGLEMAPDMSSDIDDNRNFAQTFN